MHLKVDREKHFQSKRGCIETPFDVNMFEMKIITMRAIEIKVWHCEKKTNFN